MIKSPSQLTFFEHKSTRFRPIERKVAVKRAEATAFHEPYRGNRHRCWTCIGGRPGGQCAARPDGRFLGRLDGRFLGQLDGRFAGRLAGPIAGWPAGQLAGQPAGRFAGGM